MSVFEEIKEGLKQAIAYNDGELQARVSEVSTGENGETKRVERVILKGDNKEIERSNKNRPRYEKS